jgi:hypothetical protein
MNYKTFLFVINSLIPYRSYLVFVNACHFHLSNFSGKDGAYQSGTLYCTPL